MSGPAQEPTSRGTILLVGNPNVGKSVIFGALTRRYVNVSNYPGTTVEITRGSARKLPGEPEIIDTPGTNSLTPQSEDEQVTRDILLREPNATIIQVGDTKNLRRVLYLTVQLAELGRRQVLILNLQDEARDLGIRVDVGILERHLKIPVLPATATRGAGLDVIPTRLASAGVASFLPSYPAAVEARTREVAALLPAHLGGARDGLALMLLSNDRTLLQWARGSLSEEVRHRIDAVRVALDRELGVPAATAIARARHRVVATLLRLAYQADRAPRGSLREKFGSAAMHPVWGVPVLLAVLLAAYGLVAVLGAGTLVDLLEKRFFGEFVNPLALDLVDRWVPWQWARDLLVGPYGLVTMALTYSIAIVLPVVGTFFIFFGILEDTGYLPRLAVMLNRVFRSMGLNGKAVLPMVLGLGCDTMATLTARILPSRKERVIVTLLLALGVPCSAQLGVILAMLASLSPLGTVVWIVVVAATLLGVGWGAARILPGQSSDFVLEVPPIRLPSVINVVIKTVARTEWYLREAVPLFVIGTLLLYGLDASGALSHIERFSRPLIVGALGLPERAADAFLLGFLRRDYGAAGLFALRQQGALDGIQTVVSLVVITLFVPCIANLLMMIKERGIAVTAAIMAFIIPVAFLVGAIVNLVLRGLGVVL